MEYMSTQLATINLPLGSVETYIAHVNQLPMLSAEEEKTYAEQFQEEGNLESARKMVLAHLRYVVRVARGYVGYGLPLADLIQEGNLGLMKAVKRFDPTMGVRLVSFAVHWIKAEIHEFVIRNWRIVKVATTKAQRKLFFNLRNMKKRLGWFSDEEVSSVAEDLGVSREEVLRMEQRLNAMDAPYDGPDSDDDNAYLAPSHTLGDLTADPAMLVESKDMADSDKHSLYQALSELDDRSQDILNRRWLSDNKATLQELAEEYQVSAERIRQLEKNAMKKLRESIEAEAA
jgi:RNA polymerase sigma-32 factor